MLKEFCFDNKSLEVKGLLNQLISIRDRNAIWRSLKVFPALRKRRVFLITILNTLLGFLDLLALVLVSTLVSVALGKEDNSMLNRIQIFLNGIWSVGWDKSKVTYLLLTAVTFLFLLKTYLSITFTRKMLHLFSLNAAHLSAELVQRLLKKQITDLQSTSSYQKLYLITRGVEVIALQTLVTFFVLISDVFMALLLLVFVFLVNPLVAAIVFIVFTLVGLLLYTQLHLKAGQLGEKSTDLNIRSNQAIVEAFRSYRELVVSNRRPFYIQKISELRRTIAHTSAELGFMPYVSKYVIEVTVLLIAILIPSIQLLLGQTSDGIESIAIFLVAGTRLAPAALRIQQSLLQIKSSMGMAIPTLELIEGIGNEELTNNVSEGVSREHFGFLSEIKIEDLSYTYPSGNREAISRVNLEIYPGEQVAIVGPSGGGKSTLVDLMLGIIKADLGDVTISGVSPLEAFSKWPGAVAYVPQDVFISDGTVRENLTLGYDPKELSDIEIMEKIHTVVLSDYLSSLPEGLNTQVGEGGSKLSGGQRQRLGIARALISNPRLLVLDEVTSSLDGETEETLTATLKILKGDVTTIFIAHRISTVMNADKVIYINKGQIEAIGTFEEVKEMIPEFNNQANQLGF